jgi:hypothetical protein
MKFILWIVNFILIVFSVLLWIILVNIGLNILETTIYTWKGLEIIPQAQSLIYNLMIFISLILLFLWLQFNKNNLTNFLFILLGVLILLSIVCAGLFLGFPSPNRLSRTESMNINSLEVSSKNRVYHLISFPIIYDDEDVESYDANDPINDNFYLYRCEKYGIICRKIYNTQELLRRVHRNIPVKAELKLNPSINKVQVKVNEKLVYTEPTK